MLRLSRRPPGAHLRGALLAASVLLTSACGSPCASDAAVYVEDGEASSTFEAAVDALSEGEVLHVCPGTHVVSAGSFVPAGATITGDGERADTVIDAQDVDSEVLDLLDGVTLQHLTITGGGGHSNCPCEDVDLGPVIGGAVTFIGNAKLIDVAVTGNHAGYGGGLALYGFGAEVTLTDSAVSDNRAMAGGGLAIFGDAHVYSERTTWGNTPDDVGFFDWEMDSGDVDPIASAIAPGDTFDCDWETKSCE
jgi:hypothetical protein